MRIFLHVKNMFSASCKILAVFCRIGRNVETALAAMLWLSQCRMAARELRKLGFHSRIREIFPSSCKRNVIVATWQKSSPCIGKEM